MDTERLKEQAAERAVEFIESGMVVGLGHGSTTAYALQRIADLIHKEQLSDIYGIPCSLEVESEALRLRIPLTTLEDQPVIDLTIDGADEIDPSLNLIKGGGGALLREKIVAQTSRREIIIADESKLSSALGTHWPVPVEVVPFGWQSQARFIESLGAEVVLRQADDEMPFRTDYNNLVLDCRFGPIADTVGLARQLEGRAGIVEHGLFLGLATDVIVATAEGIRHLKPASEGDS
jgi:ribose 5-phosphate isomerase A